MKSIYFLVPVLFTVAVACGGSTDDENAEAGKKNDTLTAKKPTADTFTVFAHVQFPSKDGIMITGDSYEVIPGSQYILLCHQAGYSRGEYRETAKKLVEMGYNCLAIDLRSGKECNGVVNETAQRAQDQGVSAGYLDAEQDIEAALDYIHNLTYNKTHNKVIVIGSSYSASLALKMAVANERIMAVAAFSPGEYFNGIKLSNVIKGLSKPVFATSSQEENADLVKLLEGIDPAYKTIYKPTAEGNHGSCVLWPDSPCKDEYWQAFTAFLGKVGHGHRPQ